MTGLLIANRFSNRSYAVRRVSGFSAYLNYEDVRGLLNDNCVHMNIQQGRCLVF